MNRSILIVICDFLLVSLLAFSTVDLTKISKPSGTPNLTLNKPEGGTTNRVTAQQDMGDVMRMALEQERKNRDELLGELTHTRELVTQREQLVANAQNQLRAKEEQAAQLQAERTNLLGQVSQAQASIENLNQQLHSTTVESVISKEQRAALEAEARKQTQKESELQRALAELQRNNQAMLAERGALAGQLQMSEESNRVAIARMSQLQDEVQVQRQENAKLTEGVTALATKSSDLAKEIRENTPQAPNEIFDSLVTNRVLASFYGIKSAGAFGTGSPKYKQAETVLVTDGTNTFAVCHIQDTPLTLWNPGAQWAELTGSLARGTGLFEMSFLSFDSVDPRIVMIPVPASAVHSFGGQVYHVAKDPFKFEDAVVVGTQADYYGQVKFQIDLSAPEYLKMDHNSLKGLFGKFNPSSGDLVFSKSGQLIGVMANNNYCVMVRSFSPSATFRLGPDLRDQPTAQTLSSLYAVVAELPYKLQ
jgi:hypothetical protein